MTRSVSRPLALALLGLIAMLGGGCASGPSYTTMSEQIGPVAPGQGRIYFYRDGSPFGSAVQPNIRLNGDVVGKSKPGGFFYVDRAPGGYEVSCETETQKSLSMTLTAGETRYVRTRVSFGVVLGHVRPVLEDEEQAMKTLGKSKYTGPPLGGGEE
jgi:hypothetical protein